ncbi:MAG: formylglycine-generating enzyme family protein [Bacteroidales bacterium]|jgi:formylglycine-generating enzyme required for sulfatase activity|nr:formylglycine-generating enzyme family protein [Bacteroidales bacterium]
MRFWKPFFRGFVSGNEPSYFKGYNLPVETVNWDNVQAFIKKLNTATGKNYRLPTEAEWEYAARGGKSNGFKYSGSNDVNAVAWYDGNSENKTHPVGAKTPNELGIYDMSGNVHEWCCDWYAGYDGSSQNNPVGPSSGYLRVSRGGSFSNSPQNVRVSMSYMPYRAYRAETEFFTPEKLKNVKN